MIEVELTWGRVLTIWWAVIWRWLLASLGTALIAGIVCSVIEQVSGQRGLTLPVGSMVLPIVWIAIGPWALRAGLRAKYRDFRIVAAAGSAAHQLVPVHNSVD